MPYLVTQILPLKSTVPVLFNHSKSYIMDSHYGNSEYIAHAWRKLCIFGEKISCNHGLDLIKSLNRSNNRYCSLRAHLFPSYHLSKVPWIHILTLEYQSLSWKIFVFLGVHHCACMFQMKFQPVKRENIDISHQGADRKNYKISPVSDRSIAFHALIIKLGN